jgi:hypothetical protein
MTIPLPLHYTEKILAFLREIGLEYRVVDEEFNSFLKGITIVNGVLKINIQELLCVGDILHEAGHLACIPLNLRLKANDNISESLGVNYACELGVIAWSVAAARHLEIPLSEVFNAGGYKGDAAWMLEQYNSGNHLGLPLLQWLGLAAYEEELDGDKIFPFPKMKRWTRAEE